MQSVENKTLSRIYGHGRGWAFTPTAFRDLGDLPAIGMALVRLARRGTIRRLAQGLYDYPKTHPKLGLLAPPTETIAQALADSDKLKLQPAGAYAANLLGLSEQVPMKVVYLTTGTPRRVRIGPREIILKRTTPRQMATAGRISGLVIQALRHLGKDQIDAALLARLRTRLTPDEKKQLLADIKNAPAWMARYLRDLAGE